MGDSSLMGRGLAKLVILFLITFRFATGRVALANNKVSPLVTYTAADDQWASGLVNIAKELVKTPSSCIPGDIVMLTMSNGYHWNLLDLKVSKILNKTCFFNRYLVITIDSDAHDKCKAHAAVQHCFLYHTELAPSDWKKADYYSIVYIKIKAMKALIEANLPAFFFDTDIIFFKVPPFPPPNTYDLVHQMEHFDMACELKSGVQGGLYAEANPNCRGYGINTGQFGLWPSPITVRLLNKTFRCGQRSTSPNYSGPPIGTQDCMNIVVKRMTNLRTMKLPSHFGGHCWCRGLLSKLQLTTYHTHCIGSEVGKMKVMLEVAGKGHARELDAW